MHPSGKHEERAIEIATEIAKKSQITAQIVKDAVNLSANVSLEEGLAQERNLFFSCFATEDQVGGRRC